MSENSTTQSFLKIGLWNANGLSSDSIDNIIQNLHEHTHILFITETWLLENRKLHTHWQNYNTYGIQAPGKYSGQDGLSYIVNPDFPYPVIPIINNNPLSNKFTISCRIQNFVIHCFYLPPRLSNQLCIDIVQSFIDEYENSTYEIILCGDFNSRLGSLTGDFTTRGGTQVSCVTERGSLFTKLIIDNGLTLWNQQLGYGVPTYLTGAGHHEKSSIIDFFLSPPTHTLINPSIDRKSVV